MSDIAPTAANIIASLGIKGATVSENSPGYIPILDENGKLSANLIPSDATQLAIPTLSDVAFVDPYTDVAYDIRKGSVVAPFKSLKEAVERYVPTEDARSARYAAFLLAPGKYDDALINFKSSSSVSPMKSDPPDKVFIIGLGRCTFGSTTVGIKGMRTESGTRAALLLQNVFIEQGTLAVGTLSDIAIIGCSRVNVLRATSGSTLRLSSDSRVSSTNIGTISYLSEAGSVGNTSTVHGSTVGDALSRLGRRAIRVLNMTADSSGLHVDSGSSFVDVLASSSDSTDVFDLRARERMLVKAINGLVQNGKDIVAETVTAGTVTADAIEVNELKMDQMTIGGYKLTIDGYGYMVVVDGTDNPLQPPGSVVLLRDSASGVVYVLGVVSGRLYIADADSDDSSSGSTEILDSLSVFDDETGYTYSVSAENGRIIITRTGE